MWMELLIKSALVLAGALVVMLMMRRGTSAGRHALGVGALASLLVLPVLLISLPHWSPISTTFLVQAVFPSLAAAAWAAGALLLLTRLAVGWIRCTRLARNGETLERRGGATVVRADVPSAMMWGFVKPVVFLPLES